MSLAPTSVRGRGGVQCPRDILCMLMVMMMVMMMMSIMMAIMMMVVMMVRW